MPTQAAVGETSADDRTIAAAEAETTAGRDRARKPCPTQGRASREADRSPGKMSPVVLSAVMVVCAAAVDWDLAVAVGLRWLSEAARLLRVADQKVTGTVLSGTTWGRTIIGVVLDEVDRKAGN